MSSKAVSPTANILRSSRLFSLPPPLARPLTDGISPTATAPYPTLQAVITPHSSLSRGDWGLKRALPPRTIARTSTPIIRVNALDTIEHITDFDSSADLALTLQKFLELNLPITNNPPRTQYSRDVHSKSIFETEVDNTVPVPVSKNSSSQKRRQITRWKFKGPWLAGMDEDEFQVYIAKKLKGRKVEFSAFLERKFAESIRSGKTPSSQTFGEYVKHLRSDLNASSELAHHVEEFLDLPAGGAEESSTNLVSRYDLSQKGPPSSHPSAGLSYLRTTAHLSNHPILGPQSRPSPVQARVVQGIKNAADVNRVDPKLGIAGFIASDTPSVDGRMVAGERPTDKEMSEYTTEGRMARMDKGATTVGVAIKGGNRIWVEPYRATVESDGRLRIVAANADKTAVGVHIGDFIAPRVQLPTNRAVPLDLGSEKGSSKRDTTSQTQSASGEPEPNLGYGIDSTEALSGDGTANAVKSLERNFGRRRP